MRRAAILLPLALFAACATPSPPPAETPFAKALIERSDAGLEEKPPPSPIRAPEQGQAESRDVDLAGAIAEVLGATPEAVRRRIFFSGRSGEKRSGFTFDRGMFRSKLPPLPEFVVLAAVRDPAVRAAAERYAAARAGYRLSEELAELVTLYRAFAADAKPGMPYLGLEELSGEVVEKTVAMAYEDLRAAIRDTGAVAIEILADAARLAAARQILAEDLQLERDLLKVLESRFESGKESQAALLAFQARVEKLETELAILNDRRGVIRARVARLLVGSAGVDLGPDVTFESLGLAPSAIDVNAATTFVDRAHELRQELRRAVLAEERAAAALRMAETMALPHARFPGTKPMPGAKPDFGVRAGRVQEMAARKAAATRAREAMAARLLEEVRIAVFAYESAARKVWLFEKKVLPLAEKAVSAVRGAYEGNRAGYLDLLEALRRQLDARLGLADAQRDLGRAQAGLLRAVGTLPERVRSRVDRLVDPSEFRNLIRDKRVIASNRSGAAFGTAAKARPRIEREP